MKCKCSKPTHSGLRSPLTLDGPLPSLSDLSHWWLLASWPRVVASEKNLSHLKHYTETRDFLVWDFAGFFFFFLFEVMTPNSIASLSMSSWKHSVFTKECEGQSSWGCWACTSHTCRITQMDFQQTPQSSPREKTGEGEIKDRRGFSSLYANVGRNTRNLNIFPAPVAPQPELR